MPGVGTEQAPLYSEHAPAGPTAAPTHRLMSLDALRGFDMFWIVGAEDIEKVWKERAAQRATDANGNGSPVVAGNLAAAH